jgi:hypothetical protein
VEIIKIKIHEKYGERWALDNDPALLFLATSVSISPTVGIACLPSRQLVNNTFQGEKLLVSGWGTIKEGEEIYPDNLMAAFVTGVSHEECSDLYKHTEHQVNVFMGGYF